MNACPEEAAAAGAARLGEDPGAHAVSCPICRETAYVTRCLVRLSEADRTHGLPDSRVLWSKARLIRKWALEERAIEPLDRMHGLAQALGLALFAFFAIWEWPLLQKGLSFDLTGVLLSGGAMGFVTLAAGALGLAGFVTLFMAQTLLTEP
jgi:hypothetical protein